MNAWVPPTADQQIEFLGKIQRLVTEGDFVATYKYALLMSLADLAVEKGDDTGAPLSLTMGEIAEHFVALYWLQSVPYASGIPGAEVNVLLQNKGRQAAIINHIVNLRSNTTGSLSDVQTSPGWSGMVKNIARVVRGMPVNYLQNTGPDTDAFLYEIPVPRKPLLLLPGVAYNLRKYHGFIHQLARGGWIEHVRSNARNSSIIGRVDDLESFMFGAGRRQLKDVAQVLHPMQNGRCFYCHGQLRRSGEVDHFIPWSRYSKDTAHNFVLAHRSCNNDKRNILASYRHLAKWMGRNEVNGVELGGHLEDIGFMVDMTATASVAHWAYRQGVNLEAHGWDARGVREPLTNECLSLF